MPKPAKPTNKDKDKAKMKAAWKTTTLFVVFGSVIFAIFWWARHDDESDVAWKIRNLLGIELLEKPAPAPAPPVIEPEPQPEPEPEPIVFEESAAPEPEELTWPDFRSRSELWPDTLKVMVDEEVTLTYRGNTYGEVSFTPGQALRVMGLSDSGYVLGRTGGTGMEVHVSETNFSSWFEENHGELFEITVPEKESIRQAEDYEEELITELRRWCLQNFNTPLIEINEDNLVLRWHSRSRGESQANYSLEALSVARAYLRIQTQLGGKDNYASCEIRDPDSGKLMGSNGIFIPRF
jgi:hypothetical protein